MRPVELDDLHGELLRGEEVRRGAVAGRVLEAEVEEGEKDGVLVGRGEAALGEELEPSGIVADHPPEISVSARLLDAVALTRKCVIRTLTSQSLTT